MPFNGSGTYAAPASTWNPAVSGTDIDATDWIALLADLTTALSLVICKDGQSTPTANLPMGSFKITGLAAGTSASDALRVDQIAKNTIVWAAAGGTANAITASYTPANAALADGMLLGFRASAANSTTTPTFAPDGLTAHTIVRRGGAALVAGDIPAANAECLVRYNLASTRWELLNPEPLMATQADQETGTSIVASVSPGRQQYHPSAVKAWAFADPAANVSANFNCATVSDNGTGDITFNIGTDMSSAAFVSFAQGEIDPAGSAATTYSSHVIATDYTAGTVRANHRRVSDGTLIDPTNWMFLALGDQ